MLDEPAVDDESGQEHDVRERGASPDHIDPEVKDVNTLVMNTMSPAGVYAEPFKHNDSASGERGFRRRIPSPVLVVGILAIVAMFIFVGTRPSDWASIGQGPTPRVTVLNGPGIAGGGSYRFTTVKIERITNGAYWLNRVLRRGNIQKLNTTVSDTQVQNAAIAEMENSQRTAYSVASSILGTQVEPVRPGVAVIILVPGGQADRGNLKRGDLIIAVDGKPLKKAQDLVSLVRASGGQTMRLEVISARDMASGRTHITHVTPSKEHGQYELGIQIADSGALPAPTIVLNSHGVGGPSAGLIFTLAYLDMLGPGNLREGKVVSGTGTIALDGTVGEVGGVQYKVEGAIDAHARVFFAPTAEAEQARAQADGRIPVVAVSQVEEAVNWLCTHGGKNPACATTALAIP